jgi:phage virion morphogenesis protein
MAGVKLDFSTAHEFGDALARLKIDRAALNKDIGEYLLRSVDLRFRAERGPDGAPWVPLSERTKATKKNRKILTEDGGLRRLSLLATNDAAEIGANVIYGAIHQLGGEAGPRDRRVTLPARPYLGINKADEAEIQALINEHIEAALSTGIT